MTSLRIDNIAAITRCARPGSGSASSSTSLRGTICQDSPYLSLSHPHMLSCPPSAVRASQYRSTSA